MDELSAGQRRDRLSILQFAVVPFDSPMQRPQQLALQFAQRHDVYYIEPHRSIVTVLRSRGEQAKPFAAGARPENLHIFDPKPVMPASGVIPLLNRWNYARTAKSIHRMIRSAGLAAPNVLLASFPKHVDALRHFSGLHVVYDVMDDYPHFFPGRQGKTLRRMHERLLDQADEIIASSRTLAERCRGDGRSITVVSNGVSERFVRDCGAVEPAPEILKYPQPRIGYVGSLANWFDWNVIVGLAKDYPTGSILLIGPIEAPPPSLPPNVHLLGPRQHATLPAILRAFDIGLIPFKISELIDAVNPVKLYEYFAAGIAVAASPFREMQDFADTVQLCRTQAEWSNAVRHALQPAATEIVSNRREIANKNLWSMKATDFEKKLRRV